MLKSWIVTLSVVALAVSGAGQSTPSPSSTEPEPETIRKRVDEVNLVFTVADKRGNFVKNLTKDDFALLDNKKPPQAILSFTAETDLPLRVGIVMDSSNSVRDRFRFQQDAAAEFLNTVLRPKGDEAFVLGFDSKYEVTQDFTADTGKLTKGINKLRPGGGSAVYDAVYFACRDKLMKAAPGQRTRKAIILLSDGEDNQSHVTLEEAVEMAQRAEVMIYAISTNVIGDRGRGDKILEVMAEITGGRVFSNVKLEELANAFAGIQEELRSQYALAYRPADFKLDGKFRRIELVAKADKKLQVRTREGYYAPIE